MKFRECTFSLSGVIPLASYENSRPGFSITAELAENEELESAMSFCQRYLHGLMEMEINRGKAEYIERAYADKIRFYEKDGRKYPSVTSILYWDAEWRVTLDHLTQLASRGTIVGSMVETYLATGLWLDPETSPLLVDDVAILKTGSSKLSWDDCSHKAFCEKFGKDITVENVQGTVFNDEHIYAGTYDILGTFEGKKALMDVKCGGHNMAQLAAYAVCAPDVTTMVVLPVGPTDNKCGYMRPIICEDIQGEFEKFLQARAKFKARFGI